MQVIYVSKDYLGKKSLLIKLPYTKQFGISIVHTKWRIPKFYFCSPFSFESMVEFSQAICDKKT
jgi:hypothetical protein